jgi:hypothetical protein
MKETRIQESEMRSDGLLKIEIRVGEIETETGDIKLKF